jgi:hypothetical protein
MRLHDSNDALYFPTEPENHLCYQHNSQRSNNHLRYITPHLPQKAYCC